jgi:hypothetical protein
MPKLSYTRDELLANHDFARPHVEAEYRLHGGFDGNGTYVSPRTLHRTAAIGAWSDAVKARGYPLVDSSQQLLKREHYPNRAQQNFLLELGLGQSLWNSLSVTGVVEARGRALAQNAAPDFQRIIVEDISQTATGHLNKGLLVAHGLDEGGDPERGEGGHDRMWFAVRDMLFGAHAYPHALVPESLARPEAGRRLPQLPPEYENWILLLMNVLMIEVRAEHFFQFCTDVMRDPSNFRDRSDVALHAAELVDRIRQDEAPHVGYLTAVISELRSFTFRTVDRGTVKSAALIDPIWRGMVDWHSVANADFQREQSRQALHAMLATRPNGAALIGPFDLLEHREAA